MLTYLKENLSVYKTVDAQTTKIVEGIRSQLKEAGLPYTINQVGSMFTLFFTDTQVVDFDTAKTSDTAKFAKYFQGPLKRGVYPAPSQYEAMFI